MEERKRFWKSIKFWIGIVITVVLIIGIIFLLKKPKFEVDDFTITAETTNYTSIENTTRYTGEGVITTSDKKNTYLVVLRVKLKSGGSDYSQPEYCTVVIVDKGKGEFVTYDSGDEGKITKPQYKFEIVGSIKL